jgi:hypothetical protein
MQPTFFVSASGQDNRDGRSEAAAFKTLARAVQAVIGSSVKTITVLGTISGTTTEITNGGPSEILITGRPNAAAVVSVSEGYVINITNSSVRFEHILLTGGTSGGLFLEEQATVTLGSGAVLKENSGMTGSLAINNGCTVTMQDNAEISGNLAHVGGGGAVWGTLIMKDNAVIKDNEAISRSNDDDTSSYGWGGGLYIENGGKLVMQDNAVISGNEAYNGGGIYNYDGTVILEGNAKITGNEATRFRKYGGFGGGLYNRGTSAVFTMSGYATISENTAGYGGGIYIGNSKVTLQDNASVSNNSTFYWANLLDDDYFGDDGAGILIVSGTLTMEGQSVISGNKAGGIGGGVCVDDDAIFIQNGGSITNNSANLGGGVYLSASAVHTQTGGSVTGNESTSESGPDIYRAE